MRIGLISDTHGDLKAWKRSVEVLGQVGILLHAGDVLYHGVFNPIGESYGPRELAAEINGCGIPMVHARGNCDSEVDQVALNNHILSEFSFVSADGLRILVNHGHAFSEEKLAQMAKDANASIVYRGHTHVPGFNQIGGVLLVNAGSCAVPKQEIPVPTVGVIDNGAVSIIDIDTGDEIMQRELNP